jgi:hypothetical protein
LQWNVSHVLSSFWYCKKIKRSFKCSIQNEQKCMSKTELRSISLSLIIGEIRFLSSVSTSPSGFLFSLMRTQMQHVTSYYNEKNSGWLSVLQLIHSRPSSAAPTHKSFPRSCRCTHQSVLLDRKLQ